MPERPHLGLADYPRLVVHGISTIFRLFSAAPNKRSNPPLVISLYSAPCERLRYRMKKPTIVVLMAVITFSVTMCAACHLKFDSFGYDDFDLAHHSQSVRNILRGSLDCSVLGIPFLGNHMVLVLFIIAPFYFLVNSPLLLIYLQTIALAIAALGIYTVGRRELSNWWAAAIAVIYLLYPPLIYLNLYEFHPVTLSIPMLIWAWYYYKQRRFLPFLLLLGLAVSCQENISLIAIAWGALAVIDRMPWKWTWLPSSLGLLYFVMIVLLIMPRINADRIQFMRIYAHLGDSFPGIIKGILMHPVRTVTSAFSPHKLAFLNALLSPTAYTSLASPLTLMPVSLVAAQRLLSQRTSEASIMYHYQAEFIPFVFLSAIYGIKRILRFEHRLARPILTVALVVLPLVAVCASGTLPTMKGILTRSSFDPMMMIEGNAMLADIPPEASVAATFDFLPKLANYRNLHSVHHVYTGHYTLSDAPYPMPHVDYLLMNTLDQLCFAPRGFYGNDNHQRLQSLLSEPGWQLQRQCEGLILFKRSSSTNSPIRLVQRVDRIPPVNMDVRQEDNHEIRLIGFNVGKQDGNLLPLTLFWERIKSGNQDYEATVSLLCGAITYSARLTPGSRIWPPQSWPTGETVSDRQTIRFDLEGADPSILQMTLRLHPIQPYTHTGDGGPPPF